MYNNHLLFAAIIETFLLKVGEQVDQAKVFLACKKIEEWYVGDGWYSDGPSFSMDYYNDYVIHPMLVDIYQVLKEKKIVSERQYNTAVKG